MPRLHIVFVALFAITLSLFSPCSAQETAKPPHHHGTFYFAWGYNKDWFSKSDIHFTDHVTDEYDFTVHDISAHDSPMFNHIFDKDISIPQFCYRFGYYFNDKHNLGIEVSFDHAKYIMDENQKTRITGHIREEHLDKDTITGAHFLYFEIGRAHV